MSRTARPLEAKGSELWLRRLVNEHPLLFNRSLAQAFGQAAFLDTTWLSPLTSDQHAEYRDTAFLDKLGITLDKRRLSQFWPYGGPRWDALGRAADGKVVMVEAKAHLGEVRSPPTKAQGESLGKIRASLGEAKAHIGSTSDHDWSGPYYQYTNRLAHLYLCRELNGVEAYLAFVYFVDAPDVRGASQAQWKAALHDLHKHLGLEQHGLTPYVGECFIDVKQLNGA